MAISSDLDIRNYVGSKTTDAGTRIPNVFDRSMFDFEFETVQSVFRVREHFVGRPDRIAYETLGEPGLWWVIFVANDIFHRDEIEVGDELVIPSMTEIFEFIEEYRRGRS